MRWIFDEINRKDDEEKQQHQCISQQATKFQRCWACWNFLDSWIRKLSHRWTPSTKNPPTPTQTHTTTMSTIMVNDEKGRWMSWTIDRNSIIVLKWIWFDLQKKRDQSFWDQIGKRSMFCDVDTKRTQVRKKRGCMEDENCFQDIDAVEFASKWKFQKYG